MINFAGVMVMLYAFVVTTDCSMVVQFAIEPLQPFSNFSMDAGALPECSTSLIGESLLLFQELDAVSFLDNIEAVCADYKKVEGCLRAILGSHNDQRLQIPLNIVLGTWEFICSDRGKSDFRLIEQSPCFDNKEKSQVVKELIELCTNGTAEPNSEDDESMCTYLQHLEECTYNILKQECGQSLAVVNQEINLVAYRALSIHRACFPDRSVDIQQSESFQM